jgi:hypothetical protein
MFILYLVFTVLQDMLRGVCEYGRSKKGGEKERTGIGRTEIGDTLRAGEQAEQASRRSTSSEQVEFN